MVACYHVVPFLQRCYAWVVTSSAVHNYWKCYKNVVRNTEVLGILLIYLHSPSGAAHPWESCVYISQTPRCRVTIYYCSCTIVHSKLLYHQLYLVYRHTLLRLTNSSKTCFIPFTYFILSREVRVYCYNTMVPQKFPKFTTDIITIYGNV